VDNAAPCGRGGHCESGECRSGQIGTVGIRAAVQSSLHHRHVCTVQLHRRIGLVFLTILLL